MSGASVSQNKNRPHLHKSALMSYNTGGLERVASGSLRDVMAKSIRLTTVLTLLVTFLVAGLLPAAGSWSCPDGTACVYTAGRGFHCLGDQCRMPCCLGSHRRHGCGQCNHAAVFGMGAASHSQQRNVREPGRCRYHEGQQVGPVMASARAAFVLDGHAHAVLPALVQTPAIQGLFVRFAPARGNRLPSHRTSPFSPRAPPGPGCACFSLAVRCGVWPECGSPIRGWT